MAPHKQFPPNTNGALGTGSLGRGGHSNNYRGGKKNRGGFNGSGHRDGGGNNNGGSYYSGNNYNGVDNGFNNGSWRTPSYGSQHQGPRAVSDALPQGLPAYPQPAFSQGHPAPWGATQYGSGYPMSHGSSGFVAPTPNHVAPNFVAPSPNTPPRIASSFSTPNATNGQAVAPTPVTPIATPISTPIATPTKAVTMSSPQFAPSKHAEQRDERMHSPGTKTTSEVGNNPRVDLAEHALTQDAPHVALQTRPQFYSPVLANVPRQQDGPARVTRRTHLREYSSNEALAYSIDKLHQKTQARFEAITQAPLTSLPNLEKGVAEELQVTLTKALETHEAHEAVSQKQRCSLLEQIGIARDSELQRESNVRHCYDRFTLKMTEALTAIDSAKNTLQFEAVRYLKHATHESTQAAEQRQIIEECREHILHLDNVRVISANTYAKTVQQVVAQVLKNLVNDASSSPKPVHSAKTGNAQLQAKSTVVEAPHGEAPPPETAEQIFSQSAMERHPEKEQQSIAEVMDHMKESEARLGLRKITNDDMDGANKEQLSPQQKDSGATKDKVNRTDAEKADLDWQTVRQSNTAQKSKSKSHTSQQSTSNGHQKSLSTDSHKSQSVALQKALSITSQKTPSSNPYKPLSDTLEEPTNTSEKSLSYTPNAPADMSQKSQLATHEKSKSDVSQPSKLEVPQPSKPDVPQPSKPDVPQPSKPDVPQPSKPDVCQLLKPNTQQPKPKTVQPKSIALQQAKPNTPRQSKPYFQQSKSTTSAQSDAITPQKSNNPSISQKVQDVPKYIAAKESAVKDNQVDATHQPTSQKPNAPQTTQKGPKLNGSMVPPAKINQMHEVFKSFAQSPPQDLLGLHSKALRMKEDLEYRLKQTGSESIMPEEGKDVYKAWIAFLNDWTFPDPLVATAIHALKDETVVLLARIEFRDKMTMEKMEKDGVSVSVEAVEKEENTADRAKTLPAGPAAGTVSKNKKKKPKKKRDAGASTDGKTDGGMSAGGNGNANAGSAPAANEARKGG